MITVKRRLNFCAGHRVFGHESKCANVHGHNYEVHIVCVGGMQELDNIGRVIDFSVIKEKVGSWIDKELDHKFLVYEKDETLIAALDTINSPYFKMNRNPTAENIAHMLIKKAHELLKANNIRVTSVTVIETPNCSATVSS